MQKKVFNDINAAAAAAAWQAKQQKNVQNRKTVSNFKLAFFKS